MRRGGDDTPEVKLGTWHAGKWAYGNFIVKILWKKDDLGLSSCFLEEILNAKGVGS